MGFRFAFVLSPLLGCASAWVSALSFLFLLLDLESACLKAVRDLLMTGPKIPFDNNAYAGENISHLTKPIKKPAKYCYADVQVFAGSPIMSTKSGSGPAAGR